MLGIPVPVSPGRRRHLSKDHDPRGRQGFGKSPSLSTKADNHPGIVAGTASKLAAKAGEIIEVARRALFAS